MNQNQNKSEGTDLEDDHDERKQNNHEEEQFAQSVHLQVYQAHLWVRSVQCRWRVYRV